MRYVLPHGGYGLGNDLIPWAKAYVLARETGARLLHPAWGTNPRKYYRIFGTSRYDHLVYRVLRRAVPRLRFTEEKYREIGIEDFSDACKVFARQLQLHERRHYLVEVTGFWGAFEGLKVARDFVLERLLFATCTQRNLYEVRRRLDQNKCTVGVHVRLGDFFPPGSSDYAGAERTSIVVAWYESICQQIESALGPYGVQFVVCSDGSREQLQPLLARGNVVFSSEMPDSDASDLVLLADADLLICSISSYSMWAAFLSSAPYVWYAPNLVQTATGLANQFIKSLGVSAPESMSDAPASPRGVPVGEDGVLPRSILEELQGVWARRQASTDIVRGGAVPFRANA